MRQHIFLLAGILGIFLFGCKNEITPSVYDPQSASTRPQPVIDSISPAGSVVAGTTPVTVYGKNFSTNVSENSIYFNGKAGTIKSATSTQLVCDTPADSGSVLVKVGVKGSLLFSKNVSYRLIIAVEPFGNFTPPTNGAIGLTPDSAGNMYFNLLASNVDNGISILTPSGTKTVFAPKTPGTIAWTSLKLGKDRRLYGVKNNRAVYTFAAGGGAAAAPWITNLSPAPKTLTDIDFDQSGLLWAGGDGAGLFSIKQDKSFKMSAFANPVRALRVFNGYLYFSALKDSAEQIFRALINGDSLGTIETMFNITTSLGIGYAGQSMTFSSDGILYIGTNSPEGIIVLTPGGSSSTPYKGYASMFGTSITSVAWGEGEKLLVSTFEGDLLIVHTQKSGAPYYGTK